MTEPLHPFWTRLPSGRETAQVFAIALGVGILTALVFTAWPGLDIAVSRLFLGADGAFELTQPLFWRLLREAFMKGFTLWYVTIAVACVLALAGKTVCSASVRAAGSIWPPVRWPARCCSSTSC